MISAAIAAGSVAAAAQCDRSTQSPIRCGYYDEGYQDGAADAQNRRSNDYRRYRSKLGDRYETFYQQGYEAGYNSTGYNTGPFPPSTNSGSATWGGRVDNRVNIIIQGNTIRAEDLTGSGLQTNFQNVDGSLPRRAMTVTATKEEGRGTVYVIQQPNRSNDFTAIVQISDPRSGADNYRVNIGWQRRTVPGQGDRYQPGRVTWRGRVDQTANIRISGNNVDTETVEGTPVYGEDFNITGYLASRPGTVNVRKIRGRGSVKVLEQPSVGNDFTAVIQVFDPSGGADNYEFEVSW
jgi:hypothetical protein